MGRPKKENKKIIASFRIDPNIYNELKEKAQTKGITVSRYIEILIGGEIDNNSKRILNMTYEPSSDTDNSKRIQEIDNKDIRLQKSESKPIEKNKIKLPKDIKQQFWHKGSMITVYSYMIKHKCSEEEARERIQGEHE